MKKSKVIAVVGATASGKSSYAIDLAQKLDTFIMKQITKESFEVNSIDAQNLDELGV